MGRPSGRGNALQLIVQTLRENAKTDLNVESAPDKGVRVTISFDHKAPTRQTN